VVPILTARDAVNNSLAFDVLARIGPPSRIAFPQLAAALRTENRAFAAAEVLAAIGPAATAIAIAALGDPRERTRAAAVDALAPRLRDTPSTLAALLPLLADPTIEVRWRVVTALGELGTPEAHTAIARLRADPAERIRHSVEYQLARASGRASGTAAGTTVSRSPSAA
jgi:HEAT repeat protein